MSDIIVKAENISKKYIIRTSDFQSQYTTLRDTISDFASNLFKKNGRQTENKEFWALKDINFEIRRGERIAFMGKNGAGKSTLLKILSRITEPSTGKITMNGKVASLLEVGTGFHPELTGRENVFFNGAILGMSKQEVKNNFDKIVDFAEIAKFIDVPVKRYSSGMYVRLAFSVAIHLRSDILILDEVFAVGDMQFINKSIKKMMQMISEDQRTVIFVSHSTDSVEKICNRGYLIKNGKIVISDNIKKINKAYLSL